MILMNTLRLRIHVSIHAPIIKLDELLARLLSVVFASLVKVLTSMSMVACWFVNGDMRGGKACFAGGRVKLVRCRTAIMGGCTSVVPYNT